MPSQTIFEFRDYRGYVNAYISHRPNGGRGEKAKIAEHLRCNPAYVSQVLKGDADFSPEQAERLNGFFSHSEDESHYFILLVLLDRAGTPSLKAHFEKQLEQALQRRLELKSRLRYDRVLDARAQATYYGSWHYAAVHMALAVPDLQTKEAIQARLRLSKKTVTETLDFLVSRGLAQERLGRYSVGTRSIHLGADSPLISKHHANWRIQALMSLDRQDAQDLHYSSVISFSPSDVPRLKNIAIQAIEEMRSLVKRSKEEAVYCYTFDFFAV